MQLPENVKTIAIPAFMNETKTYRIEQMLTASVVREFTTRTHYHILNEPSDAADATLRGTVLSHFHLAAHLRYARPAKPPVCWWS